MSHSFRLWAAAGSLFLWPFAALRADEPPIAPPAASTADREEVARLIEQLDEPAFAERQVASRKLSELGAAALPHLERIVASGSREASGRAIELLKRQFQDGNEVGRKSAKASLERLEQSKRASIAQRARNVLNPPRNPAAVPMFGGMFPGGFPNGPFRPGNGNVVTRTVITHESNGRREVEVKENDSTVKMQTLPSGRIEVEITEKRNGQDVTKRFSAKDLEELRTKDADTGKIYEQYQPARVQGVARLPDAIRPPFWGPGR